MGWQFCGQPLCAHELGLIAKVTGSCTGVSRTELAATVCELLGWRRGNGRLKSRECWALLEQLEAAGELKLPVRRATKPKGARTAVPRSARGEAPGETLCAPLGKLTPLTLTRVETPEQHRLWRELVGRYHYQGYAVAFGAQLRYLLGVSGPQPQVIGCLQFSSPAWRLAARDRWIGWDDAQRARALQRIVNNSRFLLLPRGAGPQPRECRAGACGTAHRRGLAGGLRGASAAARDPGRRHPLHRHLLPGSELARARHHQRARAHGSQPPTSRRGAEDGVRLSARRRGAPPVAARR